LRIDDDAIADHAGDAGVQNAGRDQTENEFHAVDVDGMTGVVATLIARDEGKIRCEKIDDLALPFITPLSAENCYVSHQSSVRSHQSQSAVTSLSRRSSVSVGG